MSGQIAEALVTAVALGAAVINLATGIIRLRGDGATTRRATGAKRQAPSTMT